MTLNDAYLISQIAAAGLVVPTLIYLALQIRQNTKQLRAAARYQFIEATGQMNALTGGSKQAASVLRRGLESLEGLDPDEAMQFFIIVGQFYQIHSAMFELNRDKLLPDSQWSNVRHDLTSLLSSPGGLHVWKSLGEKSFDSTFVEYVELLRSRTETAPTR